MRLPAHIAEQVANAIAGLDPDGGLPDSRGAALHALPLFADLGGCHFIRANGEFLEIAWDQNEDQPSILSEVPVAALVVGSERFPWLKELLPSRPTHAVTCPQCAGVGKIRVGDSLDVLCGACNVLGWTSPTVDPAHSEP